MLKKNFQISAPAKASIALFFVSIIQKGIAFITTPIYTRIMSQSEFGVVSVFTSWLGTIGIVTMFGLSGGVFNNGMIDYKDKRDEYTQSLLILSNVITILCFIPVMIFRSGISRILDMDFSLIILMFFIYFTQPAFNFWSARQRYEFKYRGLTFSAIIMAVLSPTIAISLIFLFPQNKVQARLFGGELALVVVYLFFYILILCKGKKRINTTYWRGAIMFNLPLIPHYLSGYILNNSDRVMISRMVSNEAAANYSLAYTVALAGNIVWGAINGSLIPYTYEKAKDKNYQAISQITIPLVLLYAIVCAVVIFLSPEVVAILAPGTYSESIYVIPAVVGGVFFSSLYFIFANVVYYYKKPKYVMYASVTSAILNLLLNYIFIPIFGYQAAGYTTLVCYILQALFDYFAMRKVVGENVYNMNHIIAISLAMILISLLSRFLYMLPIIRYGILFACVVGAAANWKRILNKMRSTKEKIRD